jgi:hypothetical protein
VNDPAKIVEEKMAVWNDGAEWPLARAGLAKA